jgi:hypothetical protein
MTKKALLVGLTYHNSPPEEELDQLPGAQNDIVVIKHCLINKHGFHPEDIQVITDGGCPICNSVPFSCRKKKKKEKK